MLTEAERAALRADVAALLPDTCDVKRPVTTTDGYGYASETSLTTVASGIACRIDPYTTRNDVSGLVAEREANRAYVMITLHWNAVIDDGDRIESGGRRYEVLQLYNTHSERAVTRVLAVRVAE